MAKQIKVTIDLNGMVSVEANGFKGKSCKEATKPIEDALGMTKGVQDKPEIHVSDVQGNQINQTYGW